MSERISKDGLAAGHQNLLGELNRLGKGHRIFSFEGRPAGSMIQIGGRDVVNFGSLDLLGVGQDEGVISMARDNLTKYGYGFISTRSLIEALPHTQFESMAAEFKGYESVMAFNTGFTASEATVEFLVRPPVALGTRMKKKDRFSTLIFHDKFAHASLQGAIAAYKISLGEQGAEQVKSFEHNDYDQLESMLEESKGFEGLVLIVCDALYSMHGDFADCVRLSQLANKYGALVLLDGAHSDGVYGHGGRGILAMQGVQEYGCMIEVMTLSKAFASIGGVVALPEATCELMKRAHPRCMFTVARPTFQVATDIDVMGLVQGEWGEERRKRVSTTAAFLRQGLREMGINILKSDSHVVPIIVGAEKQAYEIQRYLFDEWRILAPAIPQGVVSKGQALLRCSVTALHTLEEANLLLKAIEAARDRGYRFFPAEI